MFLFGICIFADSPELQKAISYDKANDLKNAEKYYKMAYDNGDKEAASYLGSLYNELKKYDLRDKYLKIASDNGDAWGLYMMGFVYDEKKQYDLAEKYYLMSSQRL